MVKKNEVQFDIVALIEKNPVTRLSKTYQNSLVIKIKSKFMGEIISYYYFVDNTLA